MKRTIPYFATGVLLGILVAFWVWALHWALENYSESRLGLQDSTTADLRPAGPEPDEASGINARVATRLYELAEDEDIAIVGMVDDGPPEIVAIDPHHRVPWLPNNASPGVAYPIAGTYTAESADAHPPLVPTDYSAGQSISGIPGVPSDTQYVRLFGDRPLAHGTYILTTRDPDVIARFQSIAGEANKAVVTDNRAPLILYIVDDRLLGATSALLAAGLASAMIYWAMRLTDKRWRLVVPWVSGATSAPLWRRDLRMRLPVLGAGLVLGACLDALAVFAVRTSWSRELLVFSALGAGAAVAIVCTAYAVLARIVISVSVRRLERA